ncbi:MAG: PfkB family carbohydrate kinase [Devosia sp.]|nr:PfkB family carbohydrate kinase [Devosia sp.]
MGDEFVGWLVAGLAEGLPIESALSRANAAAAALVGTPESCTPLRHMDHKSRDFQTALLGRRPV